jgi:hypothetical protein
MIPIADLIELLDMHGGVDKIETFRVKPFQWANRVICADGFMYTLSTRQENELIESDLVLPTKNGINHIVLEGGR